MKHRHLLTTAMALIYGNSINFGATDLVTDFRASSDAAYVCYQNARAGIQAKGKMLVDEKKTAFNTDHTLSTLAVDFESRVLLLIKESIDHYQKGQFTTSADKEDWGRKDLFDIASSIGLLTTLIDPEKSPYNNKKDGFKNANPLRDFRFLFKVVCHPVEDEFISKQIAELMDSESLTNLSNICENECKSYAPEKSEKEIQTFRKEYRDPQKKFPTLYSYVAHLKDIAFLQDMIATIDVVEKLDYASSSQSSMHTNALFRSFVILGESVTQKNLSLHTKLLFPSSFQSAWKDLTSIRNMLAHPERGVVITSQDQNNIIQNAINSLRYFKEGLRQALEKLKEFKTDARKKHYLNEVKQTSDSGDPLQELSGLTEFKQLLISSGNDAVITNEAIIDRVIKRDIPELIQTLKIEGIEALEDEFPEDLNRILLNQLLEQDLDHVLDAPTAQSIERIKTYYQNGDVVFSFPSSVLPTMYCLRQGKQLTDVDIYAIKNALKICGRRCLICKSLIDEPARLYGGLYIIGNIGMLLTKLPESVIQNLNLTTEVSGFRDFIQHGDDLVEAHQLFDEELLVRYASILLQKIYPKLVDFLKNV